MICFSAKQTMLFVEVDFSDRFERAATAGFNTMDEILSI
jgi:hydroxypyruvate isomerase